MNLNLINLDCTQWSKADWNDAYNQYCQHNMFGAKTKREYYDMVIANFEKLAHKEKQFHELNQKWLQGWRNAVAYARKNKCDINGRSLDKTLTESENKRAVETAERAEQIAIDTASRLDYHLSKEQGRI